MQKVNGYDKLWWFLLNINYRINYIGSCKAWILLISYTLYHKTQATRVYHEYKLFLVIKSEKFLFNPYLSIFLLNWIGSETQYLNNISIQGDQLELFLHPLT